MPITGTPGSTITLSAEFFNDENGALTDPTSVQLDITYGTEVGLVADYAGPFPYSGASSPAVGQVYRTGTGSFSFAWQVPSSAPSGVYVANWSFTYAGNTFLGIENFTITGGQVIPVTAGLVDLGYWTGGLSFGGNDVEFGTVDSDGIAWLWQSLTGWDGPDVTGGLIQRAADQGAWPSPQFFQPRTLTLTVMATAATQALRDLARVKLSSVVPVSQLATFRYDEPVSKLAQVRRSGVISETYPTLTDVVFTVGLVAPDPRKYAAQVKTLTSTIAPPAAGITFPLVFPVTFPPGGTPGEVFTLTNGGNFETRPVIAIQGPVVSPALANVTTGQTVSWSSLTLGASDVLAVDFYNQQAFLNGAYRPADPSSLWWNLPPGTSTIQLQSSVNTGAVVTSVWRDSWI